MINDSGENESNENDKKELGDRTIFQRNIREKFIHLVVEQIKRLRNLTFEDSTFSTQKRRHDDKRIYPKISKCTVVYLKLFAGKVNSILILFVDLILAEELQTMASGLWNEILRKCEEMAAELTRYKRELLLSELSKSDGTVQDNEKGVNELLEYVNNYPAMLLSQGDSQKSIADVTMKIQQKIHIILGNSRNSGILEGELLFVGDMRRIVDTIYEMSNAILRNINQGISSPHSIIQDSITEKVPNPSIDQKTGKLIMVKASIEKSSLNTNKDNLQQSKQTEHCDEIVDDRTTKNTYQESTLGYEKNYDGCYSTEHVRKLKTKAEKSFSNTQKDAKVMEENQMKQQQNLDGTSLEIMYMDDRKDAQKDGITENIATSIQKRDKLLEIKTEHQDDHQSHEKESPEDGKENRIDFSVVLETEQLHVSEEISDEMTAQDKTDFESVDWMIQTLGSLAREDVSEDDGGRLEFSRGDHKEETNENLYIENVILVDEGTQTEDQMMEIRKDVDVSGAKDNPKGLHDMSFEVLAESDEAEGSNVHESNSSNHGIIPKFDVDNKSDLTLLQIGEKNLDSMKYSVGEEEEGEAFCSIGKSILDHRSVAAIGIMPTRTRSIYDEIWETGDREFLLGKRHSFPCDRTIPQHGSVSDTSLSCGRFKGRNVSNVKSLNLMKTPDNKEEVNQIEDKISATNMVFPTTSQRENGVDSLCETDNNICSQNSSSFVNNHVDSNLEENAGHIAELKKAQEVSLSTDNIQDASILGETTKGKSKGSGSIKSRTSSCVIPDEAYTEKESDFDMYSAELEDIVDDTLDDLNKKYFSLNYIPEEYEDRMNDLTREKDKIETDEPLNVRNLYASFEETIDDSLEDLNQMYFSTSDIPEEYVDRITPEIVDDITDISNPKYVEDFYATILDETIDDSVDDLNLKYFSLNDIPEEYIDRINANETDPEDLLTMKSLFAPLDDSIDDSLDDLNLKYFSKCDIPEEYIDRVKERVADGKHKTETFNSFNAEDLYADYLDEMIDDSVDELNKKYYSLNDVPEEYVDRIEGERVVKHKTDISNPLQLEYLYDAYLDETIDDSLDELNSRYFSSYDIPEDYEDRMNDLTNGVESNDLENINLCINTTLDTVRNDFPRELHKESIFTSDIPDKYENRAIRSSTISFQGTIDHDNSLFSDTDTDVWEDDSLISIYNGNYYVDNIPEDFEDRQELLKKKKESYLVFAKNVVRQMTSPDQEGLSKEIVTPFKSLVDLYSAVVEMKEMVQSKNDGSEKEAPSSFPPYSDVIHSGGQYTTEEGNDVHYSPSTSRDDGEYIACTESSFESIPYVGNSSIEIESYPRYSESCKSHSEFSTISSLSAYDMPQITSSNSVASSYKMMTSSQHRESENGWSFHTCINEISSTTSLLTGNDHSLTSVSAISSNEMIPLKSVESDDVISGTYAVRKSSSFYRGSRLNCSEDCEETVMEGRNEIIEDDLMENIDPKVSLQDVYYSVPDLPASDKSEERSQIQDLQASVSDLSVYRKPMTSSENRDMSESHVKSKDGNQPVIQKDFCRNLMYLVTLMIVLGSFVMAMFLAFEYVFECSAIFCFDLHKVVRLRHLDSPVI